MKVTNTNIEESKGKIIKASSIEKYQKNGICKVELQERQLRLINEFKNECVIWLRNFGIKNASQDNLDSIIPQISRNNRTLIAKLYKVCRRFPSLRKLACDSEIIESSSELMNIDFASCCNFVNVRLDLPDENKYLLPPHQDFPYIQESNNGITWWVPFFDVTIESGAPTYIEGSHKQGILRVREFDYKTRGGSGGNSFEIAEKKEIKEVEYSKRKEVKCGEALVFSTLLVHRSERNLSNKSRIVTQLRFGDPFNDDSYKKNYPEGLYLNDKFSNNYSEYVISG